MEDGYIEDLVNRFFILAEDLSDLPESAFLINGKWYIPLYGCDTMERLFEDFKYKLAYESRDMVKVDPVNEEVCPKYWAEDKRSDAKALIFLANELSARNLRDLDESSCQAAIKAIDKLRGEVNYLKSRNESDM